MNARHAIGRIVGVGCCSRRIGCRAAGILHRSGQATWGVGVEGAQQLHAGSVVDLAETPAEDSPVGVAHQFSQPAAVGTGRVSERDTGREIRLFKVVEPGPGIPRSAENERHQRRGVVPDALVHRLRVVRKLGAQVVCPGGTPARVHGGVHVAGRRCLESVNLPGRRKQRPAQSVSDGQVRLDPPGILAVELVPVKPVLPRHWNSLIEQRAALIVVVVSHDVGNHSQ